MNPFSLLGLPVQFALDAKDLAARKRELSRALHPDRHVGKPATERRAALSRSLEVNEAARVLENPISRAEAILELLGAKQEEGAEPPVPGDFLMEMMELREELGAAGLAENVDRVEELSGQVKGKQKLALAALSQELDAALQAQELGQPVQVAAALPFLAELRYFRRFFDEVDAILDEIS